MEELMRMFMDKTPKILIAENTFAILFRKIKY